MELTCNVSSPPRYGYDFNKKFCLIVLGCVPDICYSALGIQLRNDSHILSNLVYHTFSGRSYAPHSIHYFKNSFSSVFTAGFPPGLCSLWPGITWCAFRQTEFTAHGWLTFITFGVYAIMGFLEMLMNGKPLQLRQRSVVCTCHGNSSAATVQ